jgi:DNA-binding response OmpR family regulator
VSPAEVIPFPATGGHRATILIVEPEPLIRMAVSDHLQNEQFKTLEASNPVDGITILHSDMARVDFVLCDAPLRGEEKGLALYNWIRANRPTLPLIVTSGGLAKGIDPGQFDAPLFMKPYSVEALTTKIRQMLRISRQS